MTSERRASAASRGYGHRWAKARATFLAHHPLCVYCQRLGRVTAAIIVDHVEPHKGDRVLFWDRNNWQPLCQPCHDRIKALEEAGGRDPGCDALGLPVDPLHHWNVDAPALR